MNFPLIAAAVQEDNFEVVNEGIWLTEANMQSIENELAGQAENLAAANTEVHDLTAELATANQAVADHVATIADRDATIAQLQADLQAARHQPAGEFENTTREKDDLGGNSKTPFHLSDEDPSNQIADSLLGKPKAK